MQKINIKKLLLIPTTLTFVFATGLPVAAQQGNDIVPNGTATAKKVKPVGNSIAANSGLSSANQPNTSVTENESGQAGEDNIGQRAHSMVSGMLGKHHTHSAAQRTKNCQAAQHGLETKLSRLQKNAAKHKALIDKVYNEALAYQQQNNLNPANFTDLTNAANADQTQAAQSVDALNSLSVTLDCSSSTVATNVATFKVAAQQARSDLLNYRQSVKAVLQSLKTAKQGEQ